MKHHNNLKIKIKYQSKQILNRNKYKKVMVVNKL